MNIKIKLPDVKKLPQLILKIGLPLIVFSLLYIVFYTYTNSGDPIETVTTFKQTIAMLEHVLMSLTLIVGGAFLANTIQEQ